MHTFFLSTTLSWLLVHFYLEFFFFFLKCDLILQAKSREYNKNSVKQNNAANQIEHKELKKEG